MPTRQCSKCSVEKPLDDFPKYTDGKGYTSFRGSCRDCETSARYARWARSKVTEEACAEPAAPLALKGTSTLYEIAPDGTPTPRIQWVKTNAPQEQKLQRLVEAMQSIAEPFRSAADPVPDPLANDDDLLSVYPMGDPHLGMYAWARETGADFDLEIAESHLVGAVDHLVSLAPPSRRALIVNLGDFFHMDSTANATSRSHNRLDVDTRWPKVLAVGLRTMRRCIDRALAKHDEVTVVCEIGNHDDHSAIMLALALEAYYEREPRVRIDTSPAAFHWYRFGLNLIGITHGHTVPIAQLAELMAADRPEDWGETKHRFWYTGHVHQDRLIERRGGVIIESFRTLAPRDAWAAAAGYRSGQDMKLDVIHRVHGRINRHVVGVAQLLTR